MTASQTAEIKIYIPNSVFKANLYVFSVRKFEFCVIIIISGHTISTYTFKSKTTLPSIAQKEVIITNASFQSGQYMVNNTYYTILPNLGLNLILLYFIQYYQV